jgi:hypothetical protein
MRLRVLYADPELAVVALRFHVGDLREELAAGTQSVRSNRSGPYLSSELDWAPHISAEEAGTYGREAITPTHLLTSC